MSSPGGFHEKEKEKEEKEQKARRQVLLQEFSALLAVPVRSRSLLQVSRLEALAEALDNDSSAAPSSQPGRRKRKKRRKRRLPRGVRIRRCGQGSRAMFPSFVDWPEMLGIMAGMYQKDSSALVFVLAVAFTTLVWLVTMHLALCSLLASPGPGCAASWPIWTRRTVLFVHSSSFLAVACAQLVFWLRCSSRCFLRCRQAQMLGILADMEQIDSYAVGWFCLSRCTSRCIPSCCPQAPDACHHGRYGPEGMLRVAVQKLRIFRSCSSSQVVDISCCGAEADSHGLAVQQTIEILQLLLYMWSMPLVC